jgi:hypothetical protein
MQRYRLLSLNNYFVFFEADLVGCFLVLLIGFARFAGVDFAGVGDCFLFRADVTGAG